MSPFDGVRVLEVAAWTFVPAAGALLADLGADVIKIEPPAGDPQRGLRNAQNHPEAGGPNPYVEIPNRGKRSVVADLQTDAGREVVLALAAASDVFLTSYLPSARAKFGLDVADVRAVNENIVYARGSGWGARGPMADVGGYDLAAGWATSGLAYRLTPPHGAPPPMPPAFFDLQGSSVLASAISTALFQRERTGQASEVDVSLMNVAMWAMSPDIVSGPYGPFTPVDRTKPGNPIVNWYQTRDERWLYLVLLQADRYWAELCAVLDRADLVDDPRFADASCRFANKELCVQTLDAVFARRSLAEWAQRFEKFSGVWAVGLDFAEIHHHPQVGPNGYLPSLTGHDGATFELVSAPMQFDGVPPAPAAAAPEVGQHTEAVLLDLGFDWDQIEALRRRGAFG